MRCYTIERGNEKMGMMDKMMGIMIGRMSKEEKEDMMIKMMPMMMDGVDMVAIMPKMLVRHDPFSAAPR